MRLVILLRRVCALLYVVLASLLVLNIARADVFNMPFFQTSLKFVPVRNPGNAPDMEVMSDDGTSGYGSVSYSFQIGKFEVTAAQYTEFLNAVADFDPYQLYHPLMDYDFDPNLAGANIKRIGVYGSYSYSVAAEWENQPVNYVSFWDAARFANWLHNGQPTGPQGPGTTEDGAYTLNGYNDFQDNGVTRNPGAKFWIPSEDEWYKAAYHDESSGQGGVYFDYPASSNMIPGREMGDSENNANYYDNDYLIGSPYYRTYVGEFEYSTSPYGTFDQGGNVYEWNEQLVSDDSRVIRGGSFYSIGHYSLHASERLVFYPG